MKIKKRVIGFIVALTLITGASFGETAKASTLINRTAWYSCRAHSCCQYITLSAVFDPSCKDVYWFWYLYTLAKCLHIRRNKKIYILCKRYLHYVF